MPSPSPTEGIQTPSCTPTVLQGQQDFHLQPRKAEAGSDEESACVTANIPRTDQRQTHTQMVSQGQTIHHQ